MSPEVTWVHFDKPSFDLVGLLIGSLELTAVFAILACGLGALLGLALVFRRRFAPHRLPGEDLSLVTDGWRSID